MLLVASVPVALPATFTLASTLGARTRRQRCIDNAGRLLLKKPPRWMYYVATRPGRSPRNLLTLSSIIPYGSHTEDDVLRLAAISSDEASQDPIDLAILKAARERSLFEKEPERIQFIPFDPLTKRTEVIARLEGVRTRICKRLPAPCGGHGLQYS